MHTFKDIKLDTKTTLYDIDIAEGWELVEGLKIKYQKLLDLNAPNKLLEDITKRINKLSIKLQDRTYKPQYTMRDGLNKYEVLQTPINKLIEEYNRNNKLVTRIINDNIKIKYDTMYCPIISKI